MSIVKVFLMKFLSFHCGTCCISQDPFFYAWIISADFIQEATQSIPSGPRMPRILWLCRKHLTFCKVVSQSCFVAVCSTD